jgi:hypothetical protein
MVVSVARRQSGKAAPGWHPGYKLRHLLISNARLTTPDTRQVAAAADKNDKGSLRCPCRSLHSHSIINKPPEPAWLKGLAEIDMGLTVTSTVNRVELLLTREIDRFAG